MVTCHLSPPFVWSCQGDLHPKQGKSRAGSEETEKTDKVEPEHPENLHRQDRLCRPGRNHPTCCAVEWMTEEEVLALSAAWCKHNTEECPIAACMAQRAYVHAVALPI